MNDKERTYIMNKESSWSGTSVSRPVINGESTLMTGRAFHVIRRTLRYVDGTIITRDVVMHPPAIAVLVHDTTNDRYLLEKEYRAGINDMAYGVVAGFMEPEEAPQSAMLHELAEETGINLHGTAITGIDARLRILPHMNSSE